MNAQSHTFAAILMGIMLTAASVPSSAQLEADVNAWDALDAQHAADITYREADEVFQSQAELFPENTVGDEGSRLEDLRENRIDAFVSVEIDGKLVVFSDVPRSAWFAPYVRDIAERRIVSGYRDASGLPTGLFGPADSVTIEQMAKVMLYAAGHDVDECGQQPTLNITASGSWSASFMACAEKKQWAMYGDGTVDAHRPATRAEVVMTLVQAFDAPLQERTGMGFADVTLSTQFAEAIEQAQRDGIVSGYTDPNGNPTGLFGPGDSVNRAEFAKIVTLGIQSYAKKTEQK